MYKYNNRKFNKISRNEKISRFGGMSWNFSKLIKIL